MVKVTGQTIDSYGALPSVNIYEVGTDNSTQSDDDGFFSINTASVNSELKFSFVGYSTVVMRASEVMNEKIIQLATDSELLSMVVVPPRPKDNTLLWLLLGVGAVALTIAVAGGKEEETKPKPKRKSGLKRPKRTKRTNRTKKVSKPRKTVNVTL